MRAVRPEYAFQPHTYGLSDLRPTHCNLLAGNMSQHNAATHFHEQDVGTQQGFPPLIYNHHHPVSSQPSLYQGPAEYLLGSYELDSATTAPPQLTRSGPTVFYIPEQRQGLPIPAGIPANQCTTSLHADGLPSSPVLPTSQAIGLTPYRQADSGPRRILAVPIESLSITDTTICRIVERFQAAPWRLNQGEEPIYAGKSCYFQLIDESTMTCRLCGKQERRAERLVSHVRGHFNHRPYPCGGQCGNMDW